MTWVAGVDGCRSGWLVVLRQIGDAALPRTRLVSTFAEVLALPEAPAVIAIDIPIGLPARPGVGGRPADSAARSRLGARQSSVFAVPARAAVMESDYRQACAISLRHSDPPRKVSKQTFNLFPKIREVDTLMTPELQRRIFECHPELAFWAMNAETALTKPKKMKSRPYEPGLELRRRLLIEQGFDLEFVQSQPFRTSQAGADDLLDACACCWTAARILGGRALCFPETPDLDPKGLRQDIRA